MADDDPDWMRVFKELQPRLNRAVGSGDDLVRDIRAWRSSNPVAVNFDVRPDRMGWFVEVVDVDPLPMVEDWGVQLGEIAHHFRSVLNTMLHRIALAEGVKPSGQMQFPIATSVKKWRGSRGESGRVGQLPLRVQRAIYALQPFVMSRVHGRPPGQDVLAVLAWIDNEDKHRMELTARLHVANLSYDCSPVFEDKALARGDVEERLTRDDSLTIGSHLIEIDVSPVKVVGIRRSSLDLLVDFGFLDADGASTRVEDLLEELLAATNNAIRTVLMAWGSEGFDLDRLAGSADFKRGAAFGRAAVDSLHGPGNWDKDLTRRPQ